MRRFPVFEVLTAILIVVFAIVGWQVEKNHYHPFQAQHAGQAPSALYARLTIRYPKPPIYQEEYSMQDVEGVSTFSYAIRSYNCRLITVKAPLAQITDVSFFFGKLVQDGVWQLTDKTPLADSDAIYTVYVKQVADYQQGQRTVTFTNPKYWATTAGHQYNIDLSKQKASDLLRMQSTALADPRYQQIVDDFRQFGPDEFRTNVAKAQQRARTSACK